MTTLSRRPASAFAALRASPLRALTGLAIAMAAVAVYAFSLRLERVLFGMNLDEAQVDAGVALPAAAFDGHSTGTIRLSSLSRFDIVPGTTSDSADFPARLRSIVLPFYSADLINAVLALALCAVVLLLCIRLLRRGPFVAPTTASLAIFAVLLGVGSVLSQLVRRLPFGNDSVPTDGIREGVALLISTADGGHDMGALQPSHYVSGGELGLDLFPLGIAILLAVIAAAFWLGHKMQRDTEGLV